MLDYLVVRFAQTSELPPLERSDVVARMEWEACAYSFAESPERRRQRDSFMISAIFRSCGSVGIVIIIGRRGFAVGIGPPCSQRS